MNCSCVCRSWPDAAIEVLYNEVNLGGTQVYKFRKSLIRNQGQHSLIQEGHLVRMLEICYDGQYVKGDWDMEEADDGEYDEEYQDRYRDVCSGGAELTRVEFKQLLENLPNLKIFDMDTSQYFWDYLKYMQDFDSSQHLKKIEEILVDNRVAVAKEYQTLAFQICLNFRSTLKRLVVPYYDDEYYGLETNGEVGDALRLSACL